MDLAFREGWTDLLNILPPVTVEIIDGVEVWKVRNPAALFRGFL